MSCRVVSCGLASGRLIWSPYPYPCPCRYWVLHPAVLVYYKSDKDRKQSPDKPTSTRVASRHHVLQACLNLIGSACLPVFGVCCCSDSIKIETIKRVELAQQGKGSDAGCRINFETWASARIFELMADNAEQGKIWHLHLDELVTARIEKEQREREAVKKVRLVFTSHHRLIVLPCLGPSLMVGCPLTVVSAALLICCSAVLLGCSKRLICGRPNSTSSSASVALSLLVLSSGSFAVSRLPVVCCAVVCCVLHVVQAGRRGPEASFRGGAPSAAPGRDGPRAGRTRPRPQAARGRPRAGQGTQGGGARGSRAAVPGKVREALSMSPSCWLLPLRCCQAGRLAMCAMCHSRAHCVRACVRACMPAGWPSVSPSWKQPAKR